jgi:pyruvate ferredoxin oxidoreductase alpha subunit
LSVEGPENADVGILTLGSIAGTLHEARDAYKETRASKLLKLRAFRPFPADALREACAGLSDLVVLERALSPGGGGIVGAEVRAALYGHDGAPRVHNFAVGLGGRDVPLDLYPRLMAAIEKPPSEPFAIFDVELEKLPPEDR